MNLIIISQTITFATLSLFAIHHLHHKIHVKKCFMTRTNGEGNCMGVPCWCHHIRLNQAYPTRLGFFCHGTTSFAPPQVWGFMPKRPIVWDKLMTSIMDELNGFCDFKHIKLLYIKYIWNMLAISSMYG